MLLATLLMIIALVLFIIGSVLYPVSELATIVTTVTAIIGAFAIWFQLKRERDIKEAEFIMSYNTSFIENPEFSKLEQELEKYRKSIEKGCKPENFIDLVNEENRQSVINYLVYHEALAALIKKGVLSIKNIDDLFAYRFFLIVNNPEVQRNELCPEAQYYYGCFWLYKKWNTYRKKKGLYILMEDTALEKTNEYRKIFGV